MYRVSHLLVYWFGLTWILRVDSAWADPNLAEVARHLGKMVEHPNQSQPNQVH